MSYTGAIPNTVESDPKWILRAACVGHDDEMFPDSNAAGVARAKSICRPCPVWRECLLNALDTGDNKFGIRGGLTDRERRALAKQRAEGATELPNPKRPRQPRPETLADAVRLRTTRTQDGHLTWNGFPYLRFQNRRYTAFQAAFIVGHGREPVGFVRRACDKECFRADHLTDQVMRDALAECGTTAGYHRHTKSGEVACMPCKRARAGKGGRVSSRKKVAV